MTLSDIDSRVANNIDRDDIDSTQRLIWINDAQRRICRSHNFSFMESESNTSLVASQRNYLLPASSGSNLRFKAEISLEIISSGNDRERLKRIFKQDAEKNDRYISTTETGTPKMYSIQKGQIYLYPMPNATLTMNLEYYGFLDDLEDDTDTNALVANYPEVLEALATSFGFRYIFEEERANYWEQKAQGQIQEMILEDISNKYGNIQEGMEPESGAGITPYPNWLY